MDLEKLLLKAKEAMSHAYAPYSNAHVGAAYLLKDGSIVLGCNVENASFGLTCCAERNGMFNLISNGYNPKDLLALVIVSDFKTLTYPCGACRQVLLELAPLDMPIYMYNLEGKFKETKVSELLPFAFDKDSLNGF